MFQGTFDGQAAFSDTVCLVVFLDLLEMLSDEELITDCTYYFSIAVLLII